MKKLKILLVMRGPFTNSLGTPKVHWDLKAEYEALGHEVDVLDQSITYPKGISPASMIFGSKYTKRIQEYLKRNAYKYDVIDANYECIVHPKMSFGFKGILLVRSHGILPVYRKAHEIPRYKELIDAEKAKISFKTRLGNIYRSFLKNPTEEDFLRSAQVADVLHCLNKVEYDYFAGIGVPVQKLVLVPNGIPDKDLYTFSSIKNSSSKTNLLSFIGSWTLRKGIKDVNAIFNLVKTKIAPSPRFLLLGGYMHENTIRNDFEADNQELLQIVPAYKQEELPDLLKQAKVGVFPSYVEGFPLAVVEQLAAGIPVVAYNVPGPGEALSEFCETLLVDPGNIEEFARKLNTVLALSDEDYTKLSDKCRATSEKYKLSIVAAQFIDIYNRKQKP